MWPVSLLFSLESLLSEVCESPLYGLAAEALLVVLDRGDTALLELGVGLILLPLAEPLLTALLVLPTGGLPAEWPVLEAVEDPEDILPKLPG